MTSVDLRWGGINYVFIDGSYDTQDSSHCSKMTNFPHKTPNSFITHEEKNVENNSQNSIRTSSLSFN
ncbi:hypothetical protein EUGRSUZ_L03628 [Eucalyptus grandis]|uniref:Uncharacterized protein n=1 Tax=Eucalyptus grandis TaxID=71139 RepID=A0AAD9T7Z0_EUCGR|nr:hypothetical protein EUGRSUZ_L03628 [Eucalyptus grandis]